MKKLSISLLLIGVVIAAAAIGIGILVRDHQEVQAISAAAGIDITPEQGLALRQTALQLHLPMSGLVEFLLRVYPYTPTVSMAGAACAACGLLLLILTALIKPIISLAFLAAIAALLYLGYHNYMGPDAAHFVQTVVANVQQYFSRLVSIVRDLNVGTALTEAINNIVKP